MQPHFAFTVSSTRNLVQQLTVSIKSLLSYVQPENIHVFATPPISSEDLDHIRQLAGDVRSVDHYSDPVAKGPRSEPLYYTDKLHACKLDVDDLVLLDTDTIVLSDPIELLNDAKLSARPGNLSYSDQNWAQIGADYGGILEWLPNAGVLVFREGYHQQIEDEWNDALEIRHELNTSWTEQHALAVAASDATTSKLSHTDHVMMWNDEYPADGIVYHYNDQWNSTGVSDIMKGYVKKALGMVNR